MILRGLTSSAYGIETVRTPSITVASIPSESRLSLIIKEWAKEKGHELILVSAQRENCKEPTTQWLQRWGFVFDEMHYTHKKWSVDVDVLIDDSPAKLGAFKKKSVTGGVPIVYRQTWNTKSQKSKISIDRLSDIMSITFG